jgi:hypothetical protein
MESEAKAAAERELEKIEAEIRAKIEQEQRATEAKLRAEQQAAPPAVPLATTNTPPAAAQSTAKHDQPEKVSTGNAETGQDDPETWRSVRGSVGAQLDSLTLAELVTVADYINRKAWRKAA